MKPIFFLFCVLALASCTDKAGTGKKTVATTEGLYPDYQVWGEEGREDVTIRLQYHAGNEEGEAVAVKSPGKVLLDGEELRADSARFNGAYYEVSKPVDAFKGKHTIVFVDENKKEHREEFSFAPFTLAEPLPDNVEKKPFQLQLLDFPKAPTFIRLMMVDTSFESADVNEELTIENGVVDITEAFLANLTKGPVTLEIYREEERPVRSNAAGGGRLTMTFGLKRQFNLVD